MAKRQIKNVSFTKQEEDLFNFANSMEDFSGVMKEYIKDLMEKETGQKRPVVKKSNKNDIREQLALILQILQGSGVTIAPQMASEESTTTMINKITEQQVNDIANLLDDFGV